jgi:Holliday junction DNA helicase RuvA
MIARLTGRCVHVDEESLILDVHGVGYLVRATTGVLQEAGRAGDADVTVHVFTNVRDDAIQLFGFGTPMEQQVFVQLLSLQGVGPKVAIAVLSSCTPADLRRACDHEDVALLQSVPGVGPKVARRIVTEMRDKLAAMPVTATTTFAASISDADPDTFYDARDALVGLGMSLPDAEQALRNTDPEASPDERVRQALQSGGGKAVRT